MKNVLVCDMQILFDIEPNESEVDAYVRLSKILQNEGLKVLISGLETKTDKELEEEIGLFKE